jgi:diaminopimelate decarboxylase
LGISYNDAQASSEFSATVKRYASAVLGPLRKLKIHLLLEPGRSIVGASGALVTRVLYKKTNGSRKFVVVDAAMNDLIRPSLYKAYHEIVAVRPNASRLPETVDVVGPICETGDFFARDRDLPGLEEGDLLALLDAGAYGMVLTSNYNSRPRPTEVLLQGKAVRVIRRRETTAELLRNEI